jgi:hypothetical protein
MRIAKGGLSRAWAQWVDATGGQKRLQRFARRVLMRQWGAAARTWLELATERKKVSFC